MESAASRGCIPVHDLGGVSARVPFAGILSKAISARHALQEISAAIHFDNCKSNIEVTREISSFSHQEIEKASSRIRGLGDLDGFGPVTALLLHAQMSYSAFEQTDSVEQLDEAIRFQRLGVLLIPDWHLDKPHRMNHLAGLYQIRYDRLGELSDIDGAITCQARAIELVPEDHTANHNQAHTSKVLHGRKETEENRSLTCQTPAPTGYPYKASYLHELAFAYRCRFIRLKDLEDMNQAILCLAQSVECTPDSHPSKAICLDDLGTFYWTRFRSSNNISDIDQAILLHTAAVELIPNGHVNLSRYLGSLAASHAMRFSYCKETINIDTAIEYLGRSVELAPAGHRDKAGDLFDRDIDQAIRCQIKAVDLTPDTHRGKAGCLHEEISDLNRAIMHLTQALECSTKGSSHVPGLIYTIGTAHGARYNRLQGLLDLDQVVASLEKAAKLINGDHPDKIRCLSELGDWYRFRYDRLGDSLDLDQAVANMAQALEMIPNDHPDKPRHLRNLGMTCATRSQVPLRPREPCKKDMDQAIVLLVQASELSSGKKSLAAKAGYLNDLGILYMDRFWRYVNISDIDYAIVYQTQSVQIVPDNHAGKALFHGSLGNSYRTRFGRLAELSDINQAIVYLGRAVDLSSDDHSDKAYYISALGNSYRDRFIRFGELSDIDRAIEYQTQAITLTPSGHPNERTRLYDLGNAYEARFSYLEEVPDVNQAIECLVKASVLTPDDHPLKFSILSALGVAYGSRFEQLEDLPDVDQAISSQIQAVQLMPEGHPDSPAIFYHLGQSYWRRFVNQRVHKNLESAKSGYQKAAEFQVTDPRIQLRSARYWILTSLRLGVSPRRAYNRAMELVPHIIWLGAPVHQRYNLLMDVGNISLQAAAWAISVGNHDLALEWLEQGRSIVWNQILQLRTPFEDIYSIDPTLSQNLQRVARELGAASLRPSSGSLSSDDVLDLERRTQLHHQLASEWEGLVDKTRSIAGLKNFMHPRGVGELKPAATSGPVVIINVEFSRCDALVILPSVEKIAHVPLPTFTLDKAKSARSQLVSIIGDRRSRSRHIKALKPKSGCSSVEATLRNLWLDLVKPILVDFLGYTDGLPIDERPHVTWCTTGPLSFLPLHAAGCYGLDGSQLSAMDLVISSYTPTLSALVDSTYPSSSPSLGLLVVGQEETPGLDPLPNTAQEISVIERLSQGLQFTNLDGANASVNAVLGAMEQHGCVHLACHATQDPDNSAHSTLHLYDGGLTLEAITNRSFHDKGLAFLSACQTATGDDKRPEESIHLAAGMLMAGYPSVIATMWSIWDEDGPEVAGSVYAELIKDGKLDCKGAARALHKAVTKLREKFENESDGFMRWVPFIHMGI